MLIPFLKSRELGGKIPDIYEVISQQSTLYQGSVSGPKWYVPTDRGNHYFGEEQGQ